MAITFVQKAISADNGSGTTVTVNITAGTTGNLICGSVVSNDPQTVTSVKDNNGVTYNIVDNTDDAGDGVSMATFYLPNISGAPTSIIATFSASAIVTRIEVQEWSGVATTTPLDGHIAQQTSGATVSSGNITTTVGGDLIYGSAISAISNTALTVGSGFTIRNSGQGSGFVRPMADESQIQSSAGTIAATFTSNPTTDTCIVAVMAFKAAAVTANPVVGKIYDLPPRGFVYSEWQKWTESGLTTLPVPTLLTQTLRVQRDWPNPYPVNWYQDWREWTTLPRPTPFRPIDTYAFPPLYYNVNLWQETGNSSLPIPLTPQGQPFGLDLSQNNIPNLTWYQSWTVSGNALTAVTQNPFIQKDWPNPQRINWYQSWTESFNLTNPFSQLDWPVPKIYKPIDQFWSQRLTIFYQSETFPFVQLDYPNPQRTIWYEDWFQNLLENTLAPAFQAPFNQTDWPLPRTFNPIDQFWQNSLQLIPKPTPFFQTDWPLPRTFTPLDQFWAANPELLLQFVSGQPFTQTDWPLPKGNIPIDQFWSINTSNLPIPSPPPVEQGFAGHQWTEADVKRAAATWLGLLGAYKRWR